MKMKCERKEIGLSAIAQMVLLCLVLNLAGRWIAESVKLPIWLDMVGTYVSTFFLGIPGGMVVCVLYHILCTCLMDAPFVYVLVSLLSVVCGCLRLLRKTGISG